MVPLHCTPSPSAFQPDARSIFKSAADIIAPFLMELCNKSMPDPGHVLKMSKTPCITPLHEKLALDSSAALSYRPISNLSVISKLLVRLIAQRVANNRKQSVSRRQDCNWLIDAFNPPKLRLLKVLNDIRFAVDRGDLAALRPLDLFAAFDTVDYNTLHQRLLICFGIAEVALSWFGHAVRMNSCFGCDQTVWS